MKILENKILCTYQEWYDLLQTKDFDMIDGIGPRKNLDQWVDYEKTDNTFKTFLHEGKPVIPSLNGDLE